MGMWVICQFSITGVAPISISLKICVEVQIWRGGRGRTYSVTPDRFCISFPDSEFPFTMNAIINNLDYRPSFVKDIPNYSSVIQK